MDETAKLDCYVIASSDSTQGAKLMSLLNTDSRLNVMRIGATMLTATSPQFKDLNARSIKLIKLQYGRNALPGEVGCSLSHNFARACAAKNENGAIILEEDALVLDLSNFITDASNFLKKQKSSASILSFYNNEYKFDVKTNFETRTRWIRHPGTPSSTVAYAITQKSAQVLVIANEPFRFLADWPTSKTRFFISVARSIGHPKNPKQSQIGDRLERSMGFSFADKLQIMLFIYYMKNRKDLNGIGNYLKDLWLPRAYAKFNRVYLGSILKRKFGK